MKQTKGVTRCKTCNKEFEYYLKRPRVYCSIACRDANGRLMVECKTCGKAFTCYKHQPRIYCSNACRGKDSGGYGARGAAVSVVCLQCGKPIEKAYGGKKFCNRTCYGAHSSQHCTGENSPNYGKPSPKDTRVVNTCIICNREFKVKKCIAHKVVCCGFKCRNVYVSRKMSGKNSPLWLGGKRKYRGPSWRQAQRLARERDKVCRSCGISPAELGKALDVHHIKPFRLFGIARHLEANDLSNLVCLCYTCHTAIEWRDNRTM